jgi:hypothetical protein
MFDFLEGKVPKDRKDPGAQPVTARRLLVENAEIQIHPAAFVTIGVVETCKS